MTTDEVIVRPARAEDVATLAEVHVAARNAVYAGSLPQAHLDAYAEEIRAAYPGIFTRAETTMLCAEVGGVIVGTAGLGPPHDDDLDPLQVGELYQMRVLPDRWRAGIGNALQEACVDSCRSRGLTAVTLEVWEHNGQARAFYAHHDWAADGHRRPGPDDTEFLRLRRPL